MKEDIHYPISMEWSKEEVIHVVEFFEMIQKAQADGIRSELLVEQYKKFKAVVPSKREEKQLFAEFDQAADVSSWKTIQAAQKAEADELIKMT
ncbi:UPF0223 family protein [Salsuginibacillus kocurii]|uniref:UPF0223 family protein n=1 Tax=Salsuginibacillus kocurii TaxID=427078 RepID=UPI000374D0D3|nr:UPF0223 family protein [Salsuginibacillus kocurii]